MTVSDIRQLLERVRDGNLSPDAAHAQIVSALQAAPFEDLGFARVDHHREVRQGFPEVILGIGKTPSQIATIAERIVARGHSLLVTRVQAEAFEAVKRVIPAVTYHADARAITLT